MKEDLISLLCYIFFTLLKETFESNRLFSKFFFNISFSSVCTNIWSHKKIKKFALKKNYFVYFRWFLKECPFFRTFEEIFFKFVRWSTERRKMLCTNKMYFYSSFQLIHCLIVWFFSIKKLRNGAFTIPSCFVHLFAC